MEIFILPWQKHKHLAQTVKCGEQKISSNFCKVLFLRGEQKISFFARTWDGNLRKQTSSNRYVNFRNDVTRLRNKKEGN